MKMGGLARGARGDPAVLETWVVGADLGPGAWKESLCPFSGLLAGPRVLHA